MKKFVIVKVNEEFDLYLKDYEDGYEIWTDQRELAIVFTDKEKVKSVALNLFSLYVGVCEIVEKNKTIEELKPCTLKDLT